MYSDGASASNSALARGRLSMDGLWRDKASPECAHRFVSQNQQNTYPTITCEVGVQSSFNLIGSCRLAMRGWIATDFLLHDTTISHLLVHSRLMFACSLGNMCQIFYIIAHGW